MFYHNDPQFFQQICLENSVSPDQTAVQDQSDLGWSTLPTILSASFGSITLW